MAEAEEDEPFNRDQYNQWDNARTREDESFAPFGMNADQPIQSVPNIWTVWPKTEFGRDIKSKTAFDKYDKTLISSEFIRNVRIGAKLGEGAYGAVYLAVCEVMCTRRGRRESQRRKRWRYRRLAFKVIKPPMAKESSIIKSLKEMYALRYLRHKNICNICDVIGIPDRKTQFPYSTITMFFELCDGTLCDAMKNGIPSDYPILQKKWALPEKLSKHWFSQIALALEYIHEECFTHNDIHDENVLFQVKPYLITFADENDPVKTFEERFLSSVFKLSDFGLTESILPDETFLFTREKRNDVFDLCELLFDTGIPSRAEKRTNKIFRFKKFCKTGECDEHVRDDWPNISPELKDLVQRMPVNAGYKSLSGVPSEMTLNDILRHPWLQNNTDPRTKPFVWKEKEKKVIPVVPEVIQKRKRRQTPRYERKNRRIEKIVEMRRQRKRQKKERKRSLEGLPFERMNRNQKFIPRRKRMTRKRERQKRGLFKSLPFSQ